MAEIPENNIRAKVRAGTGRGMRNRTRHKNIRIDMTPMVDLGFLLIAFFVMTAEMNRPAQTPLVMPKETNEPATKLAVSNALTLIMDGHGKYFYYAGDWQDAFANKQVFATDLSLRNGFGNVIRAKQALLDKQAVETKKKVDSGRQALMVLIKPTGNCDYESIINALDEMMMNMVGKYAIVKPTRQELDFLNR